MVVCGRCGASVSEGKFCEKCGNPLVTKENIISNNESEQNKNKVCPKCGASNNGGKFCEKCGTPLEQGLPLPNQSKSSIFNKIGSSMNKAASDLMAVKSDFSNGTLIYKTSKVPNVQEKKIKIDEGEIAFYNNGTGFVKHNETFVTNDNDFLCFYLKNHTIIQNVINLNVKEPIKNLNDEDLINLNLVFNMELVAFDIDLFFNSLISMKQDSWKMIEVTSMMSTSINKIVNDDVVNMLKNDGNIDLRDPEAQINKFEDSIKNDINKEVEKYGLLVEKFKLSNLDTNTEEINKILIKNLYKDYTG